MLENVWAVRAEDYLQTVGDRPFIGLPREEVDRLHATLDVTRVSRDVAASEAGYLPLAVYTAVHYNYSWLVQLAPARSLGIGATLAAEGDAPPFLDAAFEAFARRELERVVALRGSCQWRLSGLINDGQLALVYIARLPQRDVEIRAGGQASFRFCGNGELITERHAFDARSQLLIDNLHAF